jgi:integrase/recombinase XerC
VIVTGKRNKTRVVPMLEPVRDAIGRYLGLCPYPVERDEPLFRGARGGPLNGELVRRVVRRARARLGLSERTTPHALRHSLRPTLRPRRAPQIAAGAARMQAVVHYRSTGGGRRAHLLDVYRKTETAPRVTRAQHDPLILRAAERNRSGVSRTMTES